MNEDITIHEAGPDDIPVIGKLAWAIWPQTYAGILSPEQLNYMMDLFYSAGSLQSQMLEKKHSFLIVEENKRPIGFASYSITDQPGVFKLHKIYVLPGQRGKGFLTRSIAFGGENLPLQIAYMVEQCSTL